MNNKKTIQKILIGLGIAIVILIAYSFIAQNPNNTNRQSSLLSSIGDSGMGQIEKTDAQLVNADILKILGSIENIEIKDDIFSNPVFRKLKDTHFSIPRPVKIGRDNPFLPIGFDIIAEAGTTIANPFSNSNPFADSNSNEETNNSFFTGSEDTTLSN
jgi:hypothetical protein